MFSGLILCLLFHLMKNTNVYGNKITVNDEHKLFLLRFSTRSLRLARFLSYLFYIGH